MGLSVGERAYLHSIKCASFDDSKESEEEEKDDEDGYDGGKAVQPERSAAATTTMVAATIKVAATVTATGEATMAVARYLEPHKALTNPCWFPMQREAHTRAKHQSRVTPERATGLLHTLVVLHLWLLLDAPCRFHYRASG